MGGLQGPLAQGLLGLLGWLWLVAGGLILQQAVDGGREVGPEGAVVVGVEVEIIVVVALVLLCFVAEAHVTTGR